MIQHLTSANLSALPDQSCFLQQLGPGSSDFDASTVAYFQYDGRFRKGKCQILQNRYIMSYSTIPLHKRAATFEDPHSDVLEISCSKTTLSRMQDACNKINKLVFRNTNLNLLNANFFFIPSEEPSLLFVTGIRCDKHVQNLHGLSGIALGMHISHHPAPKAFMHAREFNKTGLERSKANQSVKSLHTIADQLHPMLKEAVSVKKLSSNMLVIREQPKRRNISSTTLPTGFSQLDTIKKNP